MAHIIEDIENEIASLKAHGPRAFLNWSHLDGLVDVARKDLLGQPEPEKTEEAKPEPGTATETARTPTVAVTEPATPAATGEAS